MRRLPQRSAEGKTLICAKFEAPRVSISAGEFWNAKDVPLRLDDSLRILNVPFGILASDEASLNAVFPPFDFIEFAFEFCGGP
jgi:hypothetical protein